MKQELRKIFARRYLNLENKLPLEKFIPAAFVIFLLCIFILSIITFKSIERYKKDIEWVSHTHDVIKKLEDIQLNSIQLPLINRGFAITKDPVYINTYDSLKRSVKKEIADLRNLAFENIYYEKRIASLDSLVSLSVMTHEIKKDINFQEQTDITNRGRVYSREINGIIQELKVYETTLLIERKKAAELTNETLQLFIIVTSLFSFVVIGLSLFVSDRLIKNKSNAERMLLKSYEELEDRVEERTFELSQSNQNLNREISVRKKTEEHLRESEQRFRMMADSAPVLIWLSGKDKLCTYFNKVWLEFTGRTMEQELGNGWTEGVHKDDLQRCIENYICAFDKREKFEMEYRLRTADGDYKWVLDKGIPRYEGEEFIGYIGSCLDINERKKNERFLQIQYEVSKTLSESGTIEEASNRLLKNICQGIDWNFGILWLADEKNEYIKSDYFWSDSENEVDQYSGLFDISTKFSKGMGFPGMIFKNGKPSWTKDISKSENFIRKETAVKMGWNSGLGIPISNGKDVIAVVECFNKKNIEEKQDLIDVLESAGRQIGNFIERKRAEENLRISNLELEEKVKRRTSELASALAKLLKESDEKEQMQNRIKLFAHAIRSIKDCIYITDLDNNTIFVNKAFENTYGYAEEEIIGTEIPVIGKSSITHALKIDIESKTLKDGWRGELITQKKDGSSFYTYLSTSSIRNDEGNAEALVGICQDITQLKNTEEIIKKRYNLLHVLNDVIRFTNRTFDFRNAILYSINKMCEYTHWEIGHCLFIKDEKLVSSKIWNDNLSEYYFPFKDVSEKMTFEIGNSYPGKALTPGSATWVSIRELNDLKVFRRQEIADKLGLKTGIWAPIIMYNEVTGILEFFKKEEETADHEILDCIINIGFELGSLCEKLDKIGQIRQNEKILNDAQHIAKLGSWEWDVEKNTVTWSDEMYQIYELSKDEFNPTFEGFLERVHPDDTGRVKSAVMKALENKIPFNFYHRIITPSERVKIVKAQGEIYIDENGKVIRMFGTGHDVTEIMEAEEELRRTNTKLIETQKELIYNEKLAALGRFSSGIAHEIRNPLANINSLAQLILKADIDEKNKKRLNYIVTNVDIANKIIKNLLSYASPEDLDFNNINLKDILNTILESVEARCKNNDVRIVKDIPEELPMMYLDRLKLENALMNFISNSVEAMFNGGTLTVRVCEDKLNSDVVINITDTGIGIPSENMDKILEPFFTTKDEGVGLGMGLAYQTIKLHHGDFKIESSYGEGTSIEIKLPVRKIN